MKASSEEKFGGVTIRWMPHDSGFRGVVIRDGKASEPMDDDDAGRLQARLRNEAGKLHPNYFGYAQAIKRFLTYFPGGFSDPRYLEQERHYKERARDKLISGCSLEAIECGKFEIECARIVCSTSLMSVFEMTRLREVLASANGQGFLESAAQFARGDIAAGLKGMVRAITPHGRPSWPMVTFLPSLWRADVHLFLKPEKTIDFAERVGHPFAFTYDPEIHETVYASLLDLGQGVRSNIAALDPVDGVDIQSFIWVVGGYTDADLPQA